ERDLRWRKPHGVVGAIGTEDGGRAHQLNRGCPRAGHTLGLEDAVEPDVVPRWDTRAVEVRRDRRRAYGRKWSIGARSRCNERGDDRSEHKYGQNPGPLSG